MVNLFQMALSWLTGGTLDRILDSVDHKVDKETDRERIKTKAVETTVVAQARLLSSGPWSWFPLFFIAPLGFWFASVCVYSVLLCEDCLYPQEWTIAALPDPLNEWAGVIIGSLFLAKYGERLIGRLGK
jgi:hypothetical protein